jgi:hypothetical protein
LGPRHSSGKARLLWVARLDYRSSGSARKSENFVRAHFYGRATAERPKTVSRVFRANQLRARYSQRDLAVRPVFKLDLCPGIGTENGANRPRDGHPPVGRYRCRPTRPGSRHFAYPISSTRRHRSPVPSYTLMMRQ